MTPTLDAEKIAELFLVPVEFLDPTRVTSPALARKIRIYNKRRVGRVRYARRYWRRRAGR